MRPGCSGSSKQPTRSPTAQRWRDIDTRRAEARRWSNGNKNTVRILWAVALASVLSTGVVRGQDVQQPRASAPPNTPSEAGAMAAQIGGMIGGAEFMLILDKPFEAEKLFGAILSMDPNNAYARQGLERVKVAKRPNWTFLVHPFTFPKLDQAMFTYGGGPRSIQRTSSPPSGLVTVATRTTSIPTIPITRSDFSATSSAPPTTRRCANRPTTPSSSPTTSSSTATSS